MENWVNMNFVRNVIEQMQDMYTTNVNKLSIKQIWTHRTLKQNKTKNSQYNNWYITNSILDVRNYLSVKLLRISLNSGLRLNSEELRISCVKRNLCFQQKHLTPSHSRCLRSQCFQKCWCMKIVLCLSDPVWSHGDSCATVDL